MNKTLIISALLILILASCKKDSQQAGSILTAHYMFKLGTYWVYEGGNYADSQYVAATGTKNGMSFMQINDVVKNINVDTICSINTIYIGIGPTANQLQLWGYDLHNHTDAQVIFEADTPSIGTSVAQGCIFSAIIAMGGVTPNGVPGTPICYVVEYSLSNQNQEYGNALYYFYPDFGIVQKNLYGTPYGTVYWNLTRYHIIQ